MMYYVNKFVGLMTSPAFVGIGLLLTGFVVSLKGTRKAACWLVGGALAWFLIWMSPITYQMLATGLEASFPVMTAEQTPQADAIRILGGGVGANTNAYPYSELWTSADRVWHGARLYKAGKAPKIFITNEAEVPLLLDFGVPREAITVCAKARNTEEEARFIADALVETQAGGGKADTENRQHPPRILLVTSAWHMRRAMLMFQRYAPNVEIIPAATDYEALQRCGWKKDVMWKNFIPDAEMLFQNSYMVKEIIAYWGYYFLR